MEHKFSRMPSLKKDHPDSDVGNVAQAGRPCIVVAIDHKWRDLAGYVYCKLLLERLGYRVVLVRHQFVEHYCDVYAPVAVLLIHLYDRSKNAMVRRLKERGILVFLMPTEGIPTLKSIRKLAAGYYSDLSDVDIHFVWNREMASLMEQGKAIDSDRLRVVGVPRFDFYRPPLANVLTRREELVARYGLSSQSPIITWTTNFTNAGFHERNAAFLRKDWKRLQVDKVLDPQEVARRDHASRDIHFDHVLRLLRDLDEVTLLIKPHPSEDHRYYDRRLKALNAADRRRVRLICRQYIWDVLGATDVLLSRSCTTAVEAWLLEKPTLELRLNPDEWYYSPQHASGSQEVHTYEELCSWVRYYLQGGALSRELLNHRSAFIDRWCGDVDGGSTQRLVREVHQAIQRRGNRSVRRCPMGWRAMKSTLLVALMEWTNFRIHTWKVQGLRNGVDKLGRYDKYFDRSDEAYWVRRLTPALREGR